ncbi:uncharacterized protein LOC124810930 isoform X1 [Hydra vulgaris]|uniref:uncharacterized protein LOC124810930 isoform X1 n=1 Tax=Hydra vulgaris TaxID=6087 RepID=UPI001F5E5EDF|nr:uncharacterized protein LOC124810930 [Hydra vulgaris]
MNCTYFYIDNLRHHILYIKVQNAVMITMVVIGIIFNLFTIAVTLKNREACHCSTARLFLSSYVGNVCGLISMALSGVYDLKKGIPNMSCQHATDYHFLLYIGFTVNMTILVNSTYDRYQGVSNTKKNIVRIESSKKLFFRYALPSWIFSALISLLFTVLMRFKILYFDRNIVCAIIGITPMLACIGLNIHLKFFLIKMMKNAQVTKKNDSLKNISVAISMLRLTTVCHCIYLVAGFVVLYFQRKYANNTIVYLILEWISRMLYDLMFTIEAKAFFIKHPAVRKDICKFFKRLCFKKETYNSVNLKAKESFTSSFYVS